MCTPAISLPFARSIVIPAVLIAFSVSFSGAVGADSRNLCIDTGEPCFLGIDPDIYQMPLFGTYVQSGDERICATTNCRPSLRRRSTSISCAVSGPTR